MASASIPESSRRQAGRNSNSRITAPGPVGARPDGPSQRFPPPSSLRSEPQPHAGAAREALGVAAEVEFGADEAFERTRDEGDSGLAVAPGAGRLLEEVQRRP